MMSLLMALFMGLSWAQVESSEKSPVAKSEETIDKAFQREFIYLHSQKEALTKQKQKTEQNFAEKIRLAKSQTLAWQKENVSLAADNDDKHEELMELDRRKKELQKRGYSLESTFKKAQTSLSEYSAGLRFEPPAKEKAVVHTPEDLSLAQFDDIFNKAAAELETSSKVEVFPGTFLNPENKIVSGNITRFGRVAAIGSVDNTHYVLGPNGEGLLKALEASPSPNEPLLNLYVFQSLSKAALVKKQGTFIEKVADISPIFFLAMMLLLIAGLFTSLIKV